MSNVTTKWILELADRVTGPMQKLAQRVTQNSNAVEKLNTIYDRFKTHATGAIDRVTSSLKSQKKELVEMISEIPGLERLGTFMKNPLVGVAALTLATIGLGAAGTKMAYDYNEGLAKINATAQLSTTELAALKGELIDIGRESGGNFNKIPESFEKIISQVGDVNGSLEILKASTKGSIAGFTDLDVVAGAIAQTMSIVGRENANAMQVLDTFTAAKRIGAGEFQDFANNMPTLIAAGSNLGVTYEKVAGLFAYMTGKGQDAASSSMLLQNAFTALGKSDITAGFKKELKIDIFNKDGAIRDIGTIMNEIGSKLQWLSDKDKSDLLEKIGLRDVQAKNAFAILTSDADKLTEAMTATANAAGETDRAMAKTSNPMRTVHEIQDKMKAGLLKLGERIMPIVDRVFQKFNKTLDWISANKSLVMDFLEGLKNSFMVIMTPVKWLIEFLWMLRVPLLLIGVAVLFITSPFTFWILVITAVITGLTMLWNRSEKFRGTILGLVEVVKGFGSALKSYVLETVHSLISGITGLGQVFQKLFSGDFKGAFESGKQVVKDFATVGKNMTGFGIADALYKEGKTSGEKFTNGYYEGAAQVVIRDWKTSFDFTGGASVDANSISGHKDKVTPFVLDKSAKEKLSGNGGNSGSGKTITMRLDIKNYFTGVAGDLDKHVDEFAQKFVTKINDGLRDAVVALD
ncbi:MAG: phage tail tape measure protein [Chitinophagales bacterium]